MKKLFLLLLLPLVFVSAKEKRESASQPSATALQPGKTAAVRQTPLVNKFTAPRQVKAPSLANIQDAEKAMIADMESMRDVLKKVQAKNRSSAPVARQTLTVAPQPRNLRTMIDAQRKATGASILWNKDNGTPAFVTFPTSTNLKKNKIDHETLKTKAFSYMDENASWMVLQNPSSELELIDARTDELGMSHLRFQQVYQGYPVWGADLYLHYSAGGELTAMNGRWQPTPEGMPLVYALSREQAVAQAAAYLGIAAKTAHIWQAEQVIFIDDRGKAAPAWHIELGETMYDDMRVFIDGRDGAVLHAYNNVQTGTPAKGTGVDLSGQTRALDIYKVDNAYYLLNTTKNMWDGNAANTISDMQGIILVGDARNVEPDQFNYYNYIDSNNPNSWPANSVSLAFAFSRVYDYFKSVHGLTTLDNQRHNIVSVVNMGNKYNNAFWSGGIKMFCFGNGDGKVFTDLAKSFDIIAHEYGHGVTQYSSNLEYQFQSGALNEAFSDFTGVMAEYYADPANADWLIGEDCIPASSQSICLRDLTNPRNPRSLTSDYPMKMSQYADWTIDQDNGGVHRNSTIPGHAFYTLSTLMAHDKVEKIIYRAFKQYLTRRSQFIDLRLAAVQAAKDLYPSDNSAALVGQAFNRVEVYDGSETEPDPPYEPVSGNDFVLALLDESGELYQIKSDIPFKDGAAASFGVNSISKPSVTDDGTTIVYVDMNNNVNLYDAVEMKNYLITDDGYWANVAISPHADYIAFTPQYELLPSTIGILNMNTNETVTRFLSIPTTTQGAEIVADYADILDWSIEGGWLIFDCAFTLQDETGTEAYTWGIYLTNAADDAFVPIFQADTRFAVGNPSFSSTRDNVIAFDVLDYSSGGYTPEYYLYAFDLFSGDLGLVHQNVNTFGHPSFSPDDSKIVFQEESDEGIPFLSQAVMKADGLNADQNSVKAWVEPLRFPVWYAIGSRPDAVKSKNDVTPDFSLITNYPNPFNGETTLAYQLERGGEVTLQIFNINGKLLETLANREYHAAGKFTRHWNAGSAGSGVYLYRLTMPDDVMTGKAIMMK